MSKVRSTMALPSKRSRRHCCIQLLIAAFRLASTHFALHTKCWSAKAYCKNPGHEPANRSPRGGRRRTAVAVGGRVGGVVTGPTPHSAGRANFPHPVPHERGSLAAAKPCRILAGGSGCRARSSLRRAHGTTPRR